MAWAIITIFTSKCAQMEPQQLLKMSKFYSGCTKCDIEKTLGGVGTTTPLVTRRLIRMIILILGLVVGQRRIFHHGNTLLEADYPLHCEDIGLSRLRFTYSFSLMNHSEIERFAYIKYKFR